MPDRREQDALNSFIAGMLEYSAARDDTPERLRGLYVEGKITLEDFDRRLEAHLRLDDD